VLESFQEEAVKSTDRILDMQTRIKDATAAQSEEQMAITEDQLKFAEESFDKSNAIVNNAKSKEAAIIAKYDQQIADTKESLNETTETLQKQADDELFLHFETVQEKELRLVEEKYSKLLGLAQGNFLATVQLKAQEELELEEIRTRADRKELADSLAFFKEQGKQRKINIALNKKKIEADKAMQIDAAQQSFAMGVGLAKKGTAAYKALASAETIMATYTGATKALADVPSPWNFIQAGLIIATGMKNLAEISKTKVEGGPGPETMPDTVTDLAGGGDMTGGVPAITFGDAGSDVPPVQAYVIETDISNAQALQSELDLQSTL
jgi:hypothetical protein